MHAEQHSEPITVACQASTDGWTCRVRVGTQDEETEHEVTLSAEEVGRLAPGTADPTRLVEASFRYLLEREPKESILPRFSIGTIVSYFPSFPEEIRARLQASAP